MKVSQTSLCMISGFRHDYVGYLFFSDVARLAVIEVWWQPTGPIFKVLSHPWRRDPLTAQKRW